MLDWAKQFNIFCLLDNSQYQNNSSAFECLLGAGCIDSIELQSGKALERFQVFKDQNNDWMFGSLSYDLKNEIEELSSGNYDGIGFSDLCFFVPEIVIQLKEGQVNIFCENEGERIFSDISGIKNVSVGNIYPPVKIKNRVSKPEYLEIVKNVKEHIHRGDCYEINLCQEFYAESTEIDPIGVYRHLTELSPNPFSALYRWNDKYCICASPERYLRKQGKKIISQPIKGTSIRNLADKFLDEENKRHLLNSEKEKSENVMVVDLVRNDISKFCKEGTVKVDELFGIYSFPQVHQMISTVSGILEDKVSAADIFRASFPMGSMTGAPKKSVMQLIEKYEKTRRGLFSGTIGYFTPDGDFDFNVVIRSILYNESAKYLSFQTGSAITFYSDAEREFEECLLKAKAIKEVLLQSRD